MYQRIVFIKLKLVINYLKIKEYSKPIKHIIIGNIVFTQNNQP